MTIALTLLGTSLFALLVLAFILIFGDTIFYYSIKNAFKKKDVPIKKKHLRVIKEKGLPLYPYITKLAAYEPYRLLFIWLESNGIFMEFIKDFLCYKQGYTYNTYDIKRFLDRVELNKKKFFNGYYGMLHKKGFNSWLDVQEAWERFYTNFEDKEDFEEDAKFDISLEKSQQFIRKSRDNLCNLEYQHRHGNGDIHHLIYPGWHF